MQINWAALGIVAVVSVVATLAFVILLALGVRYISAATASTNPGHSAQLALCTGYISLGLAGLLVLFCLYLIVPQFH